MERVRHISFTAKRARQGICHIHIGPITIRPILAILEGEKSEHKKNKATASGDVTVSGSARTHPKGC